MYDFGDPKANETMAFINPKNEPDIIDHELNNLMYTMAELNMFPDNVDSVSEEQAILIWQAVEALIKNKGNLPDYCIM